jgi:hypothetical protein
MHGKMWIYVERIREIQVVLALSSCKPNLAYTDPCYLIERYIPSPTYQASRTKAYNTITIFCHISDILTTKHVTKDTCFKAVSGLLGLRRSFFELQASDNLVFKGIGPSVLSLALSSPLQSTTTIVDESQ